MREIEQREGEEEEKGRKEKKKKRVFPGVPMVREEKSIQASRAMRGYQNLGFHQTPLCREFSYFEYF